MPNKNNLEELSEKIRQLAKEYDIACHAVLIVPGTCALVHTYNMSWSGLEFNFNSEYKGKTGVHVKACPDLGELPEEEQKHKVCNSLNLVHAMGERFKMDAELLQGMEKNLSQELGLEAELGLGKKKKKGNKGLT